LGGKVTCTLGEIKNRADFMIYWGGNPAECHPRHFTRYTLTQKGKFVPNGRKGRTMVLVDIRETPSAKAADIFLQVRPGKDFEMVSALRAILKDPAKGERITLDYRRAGLTEKQMAMLDFAVKLTLDPVTVAEEDVDDLRAVGFSDEDTWDIVEVTAMFNFTNRLMSGTGVLPNPEYHGMAR